MSARTEHPRHTLLVLLMLLLGAATPLAAQLQPGRVIILIGPPGSGKTVQANYLRKRLEIPAISMAHVLQQELKRKSALGKALAAPLESGELVADGPANELMKARLLQPDAGRGFVLDGYPGTEAQAKALDAFLAEHSFPTPVVVVLDSSQDVLRNRMLRRRRADDQLENIERRLRNYRDIGRGVERWYGAERIVRVDAAGTPEDVASRILKGVESIRERDGLKVRSSEQESLKRR